MRSQATGNAPDSLSNEGAQMTKSNRIDAFAAAPEAMKIMMKLETQLRSSGLGAALIELVKMRVSQMNGCAHCLDLHSRQAIRAGITNQQLFVLDAWRESTVFSPRERAALEWTEELTGIMTNRANDDVYDSVRNHFSDKELVALTVIIGQINSWNRLSIGMRNEFIPDA
jgi:AhpD family alkylhydroperoxidase